MLPLNGYSTIVPSPRQAKIGSRFSSIIRQERNQILRGRIAIKALKDELDGGKGGAPGQSWDPGLEFEVPFEQRPVNEYSSLKEATLYSWAYLDPGSFFLRLGGLWLGTFTVLGVPIAAASFNLSKDPLRFVLAAGTGTLFLVSLFVLRIYLGWSYVGDRLLSAVIPYEESGWYDGQMWVKPPEILARDRLLGSYKVKPVIKLLKQTLVGTGALLIAAVSLFIFSTPVENFIQKILVQNENSSNVSASKISTKFNIRKEELLKLPVEVMSDNDLAAAAAEAADGRPVYDLFKLLPALLMLHIPSSMSFFGCFLSYILETAFYKTFLFVIFHLSSSASNTGSSVTASPNARRARVIMLWIMIFHHTKS